MARRRYEPPEIIRCLAKRLETIEGCDKKDFDFAKSITERFIRNPTLEMTEKQRLRITALNAKYALPKRKMKKSRTSRFGYICKHKIY